MGMGTLTSRSLLILGLLAGSLALSLPAKAGNPRCFLHGVITPTGDNKAKASLSDMIRLHFDAAEKEKCEQMMTAYCTYNVKNKDYSPVRLKGSFKVDMDKAEESIYGFSDKCKLLSDE